MTTSASPTISLTEWLRQRSDEQLVTLLRTRPDLGAPAPQDLATLAARITVRASLTRCLDTIDAFALHVLQALVVLADRDPDTATAQAVIDGLDPAVADDDVHAAIGRLYDRALVWDAPIVRPATGVGDLLGPYPVGLGAPAARLLADVPSAVLQPVLTQLQLPPAQQPAAGREIAAVLADRARRTALLDGCSTVARRIVGELADGRAPLVALPAGGVLVNIGDADAFLGSERDVGYAAGLRELILHALLIPIGPDLVELPREVGRQLRGDRALGTSPSQPPPSYRSIQSPQHLDASASVAVLEVLRLVDKLAGYWTVEPPNQLRQGGLSVRDLRRTARHLATSEANTVVLVEVCVAADLISAPMARDVPWRPTTLYDKWTQREPAPRWIALAQAWRSMTRLPYLAGQRDERGKARSALSYELERAGAPVARTQALRPLIDAPDGASGPPEAVLAHLQWQLPRRMAQQRDATLAALAEAESIGLTGAGGLTSYGRALLAGDVDRAQDLLHHVLPAPVDEFLIQPDLTAVVPGPPTPELNRELSLLGDLESAGGASVYRITEKSMRRAFDAGRAADTVHDFFTRRSSTPVPQALTYLIDDLARRYGVLRAGPAQSYLRCDDVALLDRVVTDRDTALLNWHRLAPTVALAAAPTTQVLEVLRTAGYTPAGEDVSGGMQLIAAGPERARPRRHTPPGSASAGVDDVQLGELVQRIRTTDQLSRTAHRVTTRQDVPGVTSATTLGVLREAVRSNHKVWLSVADNTGTATTSILEPMSLGGGFLRGFDAESGNFLSVALHRITSLNVLDD